VSPANACSDRHAQLAQSPAQPDQGQPDQRARIARLDRLEKGHAEALALEAASTVEGRLSIDVAADLKAPVLGLYAGKDTGIPLDSVEKMREALKKSKVPAEIVVYPEAQHGFHADYRPSYGEADAKDGWTKLQAWFKKHGAV
jgi:dienelactone hydrolase